MSEPMFLTFHEVIERYRGEISEGTVRNWPSMRVGPSFLKIGKAVRYPLEFRKIGHVSENQRKFEAWLIGAQGSHSIPHLHVWSPNRRR
jgi:hypothetical protein